MYLKNNVSIDEGLAWADLLGVFLAVNNDRFKSARFCSKIQFLNFTKKEIQTTHLK